MLCHGYSTTSTAALQVINAESSLDLHLKEIMHQCKIRKGIPFTFEEMVFIQIRNRPKSKRIIRTKILEAWQQRWIKISEAGTTKEFFPSVVERMNMSWIKPNHYTAQFLTGHGDFKEKLNSFQLSPDPWCEGAAGMCESSEHVLMESSLYEDTRSEILLELRAKGQSWPQTLI
ncbi:hypothetical protein TKK_0011602 [Trichogramma kaykai]|uniref:Uncharacterized protein n=2 Tax=Trichogramma kaykai TaxID=54128 RepID=A0ABD2W691_9HYME